MESKALIKDREKVGKEPSGWPGFKLYEVGRKILMASFFVIFLLIAHQKFFTGYRRSKVKLVLLMCVAPFVLAGGICCLVGWWQMELSGAFAGGGLEKERKERDRERRRRKEESNLLPWQRPGR
jgi:hypothetical protein